MKKIYIVSLLMVWCLAACEAIDGESPISIVQIENGFQIQAEVDNVDINSIDANRGNCAVMDYQSSMFGKSPKFPASLKFGETYVFSAVKVKPNGNIDELSDRLGFCNVAELTIDTSDGEWTWSF